MCAEERFSADAGQERTAEREQFGLAGQQRVVLVEALAESVAGIENDGFGRDSRRGRVAGCGQSGCTAASNSSGSSWVCVRHSSGTAARVHQHNARAQLRANGRHLRIPREAADVIHDFGAGLQGSAGGGGLVGVDGDTAWGERSESFEHRQQSGLFLFRADGLVTSRRPRASRGACFRRQIEQVRAFVEELDAWATAASGIEKQAAVAEGVGRDVHYAHHQRARAERRARVRRRQVRCHP